MNDAIPYMDLLEVSERIRTRDLSATDVTETLIKRIELLNPRLNGVLHLMADSARAQAQRADAEIESGFWRGPLHGVPIGMKDVFWTKDSPTSSGIASRRDHFYPEDATIIEKLIAAGAVLLAKLYLTEGANFDHDPSLPRPANPWGVDHWTGVSSSGPGVAVAAGFVFAAVATDSGGSIRMPSSANSVTGIKPTWGRVSRHGVFHCTESFDTIGAMARTAADAAALLQVLSGSDPRDTTALSEPVPDYSVGVGKGIGDLTIGIDWNFATDGIDAPVVQALRDALAVFESLGARVQEVRVPWTLETAFTTMAMIVAELGKSSEDHFPEKAAMSSLTGRDDGAGQKPSDVVRGYVERDRFKGALEAAFRNVDVIITPGLGEVLPTWDGIGVIGSDVNRLLWRLCRFTAAFNIAAVPTISLPAGFDSDGMPIGIQLAGPRLHEADLVRVGAAFQRVTGHHVKRPPLG